MSKTTKLSSAKNLHQLAHILGYRPRGLAYVVYGRHESEKYEKFEIPKAKGGYRTISAPKPELKKLQQHLAKYLYDVVKENQENSSGRKSLNHAFLPGHSIFTNAKIHRARRYVLNIDLEEFFPSINFGRVRGFLLKDNRFQLHEPVATLISQIACFENSLPQGAPSSPILSSLISQPLDVRLAKFAKKNFCHYSRYADDITFSTNRKEFPPAIAYEIPSGGGDWVAAPTLVKEIRNCGFEINHYKTRMQFQERRQDVNGIVVNEKINVRREYYKQARAMCHSLFANGVYWRLEPNVHGLNVEKKKYVAYGSNELEPLQGILNHIYTVRKTGNAQRAKGSQNTENPEALYSAFLFFKYFACPAKPVIITEGKTDPVYLRPAIQKTASVQPVLGEPHSDGFSYHVKFLSEKALVNDFYDLGKGTGELAKFIGKYNQRMAKYKYKTLAHPVIIIVDNDKGANPVFSAAKENGASNVSLKTTESFYKINNNLYLVKVPETDSSGAPRKKGSIESLFPDWVLKEKIGIKTFNPDKEHDAKGEFGKHVFAHEVVRPKMGEIDFSDFEILLKRVSDVLVDYGS